MFMWVMCVGVGAVLLGFGGGCGGGDKKPEKVEPLKRVKVNSGGDWVGEGSGGGLGFGNVGGFGNLPVDTTQPSTTQPGLEEDGSPKVEVTLISRLSLFGMPSRGLESGEVFLPRQTLRTGEVKTHLLGDKGDGCEITYRVGQIKDGKVPVMVEMRMWGRRVTKQKWVIQMGNEAGQTFLGATRGGEQFRFDLAVEGIPAEELKSAVPTVREEYLKRQEPGP